MTWKGRPTLPILNSWHYLPYSPPSAVSLTSLQWICSRISGFMWVGMALMLSTSYRKLIHLLPLTTDWKERLGVSLNAVSLEDQTVWVDSGNENSWLWQSHLLPDSPRTTMHPAPGRGRNYCRMRASPAAWLPPAVPQQLVHVRICHTHLCLLSQLQQGGKVSPSLPFQLAVSLCSI